jgi:hypothetical protein
MALSLHAILVVDAAHVALHDGFGALFSNPKRLLLLLDALPLKR